MVLAAEGFSQRQIAERVFGDERFRGRVERILRQPPSRQHPRGPIDPDARIDLDGLLASEGEMGSVVELVARYERQLVRSGELPPLREIERLLRIKQQLSDIAKLERLNALTRGLIAVSSAPLERQATLKSG